MDLSGLFEHYEADRARLAMHKRALQSYKKYEFLKAGLGSKTERDGASNKTRVSEVYEPFNYPGLRDSVAQVFTAGTQLRVANAGAHSNFSASRQRKGRRFEGYSEREFLEDYLGKDYAARPDLSKDADHEVFGYHTTLRELFPDPSKYLKLPKRLEEEARLKEFMGLFRQDGKPLDPRFVAYLSSKAANEDLEVFRSLLTPDAPHPTDPSRSLTQDLAERVREVGKKEAKVQGSSE